MKISKIMLNELTVPYYIAQELVAKYMEYIPEPREMVIERHEIGEAQHFDIRLWVGKPHGDYAIGWSVVGFSREHPAKIEVWLENIGKGFRAETKCISEYCNEWKFTIYEKDSKYYYKLRDIESLTIEELARQPYGWFFPKLKIGESIEIEPGEVGAGEEAPGRFTILTRGEWMSGTQKVYFHEYYLRDKKYFKEWTRIVFRAIKIPKIDPKTKKPIPGKYERLWRFMIPKTQMPYAISNRAIKEEWKPPKEYKYPFPKEWVAKKWPDQYRKWLQWITKSEEEDIKKLEKIYEELSLEELAKTINFTLGLSSWMGARAKTGRQMPKMRWFLLLDDRGKGKVRIFLLDGYPLRDVIMAAYLFDRVSRKWLTYEGEVEPDTPPFNPNKQLVGQYVIIDRGKCQYNTRREDGEEIISLVLKGAKLKGKYELRQEEAGTDVYTFEKLSKQELVTGKFVLDYHEFPEGSGRAHLDLRWKLPEWNYLEEFNLDIKPELRAILDKPIESPIVARRKKCYELEWINVKKPGTRMKAYGVWSRVSTLDYGEIEILEDSINFISMILRGKQLKGYFIARKVDNRWHFMKSKLPKQLALAELEFILAKEGDPRAGIPFDPYIIEQRRGWDYFYVHLYDLRHFTRVEPTEMVKLYLPELKIPEGVEIGIGLFPVPGRIHHTRIAYIKFSLDKWDHNSAIKWINKHKLYEFVRTQIRRPRK